MEDCAAMIQIKRVYEPKAQSDGTRVLVDRLWPRGLSKEDALLDDWQKDIAPSHELRKWFAHTPERWEEFVTRFQTELQSPDNDDTLEHLRSLAAAGTLTLVFAAKDAERNNAVVIRDWLLRRND